MLRSGFFVLCIFLLPTGCMKSEPKEITTMRAISKLENAGKCVDAASLAKKQLLGGAQLFALGSIAYNCEKNPSKGTNYLNKATILNYGPALKQLIAMGLATSAQKTKYKNIQTAKTKAKADSRQELQNALIGMGGCGSLSCMAKGAAGVSQSNTNSRGQAANTGMVFKSGQTKNSKGQTICGYKNGTVINNGYDSMCPMSIPGS